MPLRVTGVKQTADEIDDEHAKASGEENDED